MDWIPPMEATSKPPVHMEHEATQTLFCPRYSRGLVEKKAVDAFWNKLALVLLLVP